jgi:hypothetical protein
MYHLFVVRTVIYAMILACYFFCMVAKPARGTEFFLTVTVSSCHLVLFFLTLFSPCKFHMVIQSSSL